MQNNTYSRGPNRRRFNAAKQGSVPKNQARPDRPPRPNGKKSKRPAPVIKASRFINRAVERTPEAPYEPTHNFSDFALNNKTKQTLEYLGFSVPSAIQDQAIKPALEGRDIIGLANTGTGKTAAFLLPIIEKLSNRPVRGSVLILSPTRELTQQIHEEFVRFSAGQKMYATVCVGGVNIGRQIRDLQRNPHVIIATPGRLKDLIDRRAIVLSAVNTFVLDEADRMLDMGFVRDIRQIANLLPTPRQTLCFSATMTPAVHEIMTDLMTDPEIISVRRGETSDHIDQDVIEARDKAHKGDLLHDILQKDEFEKVIVFCDTKFGAQRLSDRLSKGNIPSVAIHGNKSQSQRERALKAFKTGTVKVMVATDVAARGLDVPNVSHVINYDPPKQYEDYVHRIGRTGRAGKAGQALTFIIKP